MSCYYRLLIESHTLNDLCKAGIALKKLKVINHRTSFGGRIEAKFTLSRLSDPLPAHKLSPGIYHNNQTIFNNHLICTMEPTFR